MAFLIKISKRYSCNLFPPALRFLREALGARGGTGGGARRRGCRGTRVGVGRGALSAHLTTLLSPGVPVPALFPHPQHPELPGKHCRRRKARTVFSDSQLSGLEKRFEIQRYLSTPERVELATALSLSETQVRRRRGRPVLRDS